MRNSASPTLPARTLAAHGYAQWAARSDAATLPSASSKWKRLLLDEARQRVTQTLHDKRVLLDRITAFLLEHELLDHAALVSLGTGVALAFGIFNAMWLESRSDFISDHRTRLT